MRILLVAATKAEIEPFQSLKLTDNVDVLITGVGMVASTFQLTNALGQYDYDFVVNAGIAGAFSRNLKIGNVIEVETDIFSELGVEDGNLFLSVFESRLIAENEFPYRNGKLSNPNAGMSDLPLMKGTTVNTVHGNEDSIKKVVEQFSPQIESMEGAAIAYVCLQKKVKFIQLRAISNYVEKRNKNAWNIPLAIVNLNNELNKLIVKLNAN